MSVIHRNPSSISRRCFASNLFENLIISDRYPFDLSEKAPAFQVTKRIFSTRACRKPTKSLSFPMESANKINISLLNISKSRRRQIPKIRMEFCQIYSVSHVYKLSYDLSQILSTYWSLRFPKNIGIRFDVSGSRIQHPPNKMQIESSQYFFTLEVSHSSFFYFLNSCLLFI